MRNSESHISKFLARKKEVQSIVFLFVTFSHQKKKILYDSKYEIKIININMKYKLRTSETIYRNDIIHAKS